MKGTKEKVKRIICTMVAAATISAVLPFGSTVFADNNEVTAEAQLESILSQYSGRSPQIEDGVVLLKGQSKNYAELLNPEEMGSSFTIKSMDESIASVDGDNIVAVGEGVTYIALEGETFVYLFGIEVIDSVEATIEAQNVYGDAGSNSRATRNPYYTVYIDPGHGGTDPGAVRGDLIEKTLTLNIAQKVQLALQAKGVNIIMRRNDDTYTNFRDIRGLMNKTDSDVAVSVHINSTGTTTTTATGIETFYSDAANSTTIMNQSKSLATAVQNNLISSTGANSRGVKCSDFSVISYTNMPSALAECGFINNASDALGLRSNAYLQLLANGIANGVYSYLENNVSLPLYSASRIYGATRYETSYAVARKGWTSSDTVVIASGADYPDALCAAPLANKYNAPILLASKQTLDSQSELKKILTDLKAKKAYIIGGSGVITASFESQLKGMNIETVRLGGATRYETSVLVARELGSVSEAVVASGLSFPDSLSISSIAAKKGMPILLTSTYELPGAVSQYIKASDVKTTYVVGGTGVVTDGAVKSVPGVVRLSGANRYSTNEAVFNYFKKDLSTSNMYVAVGTTFPDALSVSTLAGKESAFVLLANPVTAYSESLNIITNNSMGNIYVLGGPGVLSDSVLAKHFLSVR